VATAPGVGGAGFGGVIEGVVDALWGDVNGAGCCADRGVGRASFYAEDWTALLVFGQIEGGDPRCELGVVK
jgi:hypothetical protein